MLVVLVVRRQGNAVNLMPQGVKTLKHNYHFIKLLTCIRDMSIVKTKGQECSVVRCAPLILIGSSPFFLES